MLTAVTRHDNNVYDLFDLARVGKRQNGVSLVRGLDPSRPAYKVMNADLIPPVPESSLRDLLDSIQAERGFILLVSLKQFKKTRGTLLTLEKTDGSGSIFEIISNGKADTLDVMFTTATHQQLVSIEDAVLANGHWQNITLFVQDDRVQLYIGCTEINVSDLDVPIHRVLTQEVADVAKLRIGKGTGRDRFMVSYARLKPIYRLMMQKEMISLSVSLCCPLLTAFTHVRLDLFACQGVLQNVRFVFGTTLHDVLRSKGCTTGGEKGQKKQNNILYLQILTMQCDLNPPLFLSFYLASRLN